MPDASVRDLQRARAVFDVVLAAVAMGQGAQYALNPAFPLNSPAYGPLSRVWGRTGWQWFGLLLAAAGVLLVALPLAVRWMCHAIAACAYLLLGGAQAVSGVWPFVLLLPIAAHSGALVMTRAQWNRRPVPAAREGGG